MARTTEKHRSRQAQNLTIQLTPRTIQKARVLAAREGTSISQLVARTIERLVDRDELYESSKHRALALLDRGFALGGRIRATRSELHDR